jgi:large subunit ribosomal protein L25
MHFDLYRVDKDQEITIAVGVHFINHDEAPGLKRGGALNVVRHEVEVTCTADKIPDQLEYDLTGLDIGDTAKISDVMLPEGTTPVISDRDFMIANISAPSALLAEDAEEEDEDDETEADEDEDDDEKE